jgi:manganese efflux pump family protein
LQTFSALQLLFLIFPLGLDTLGVSLGLGMKSSPFSHLAQQERGKALPPWLRSAILFACAEMLMPIIGLFIGYAISTIVSGVMHYAGALLLIGIGAWELWEEGREQVRKRQKSGPNMRATSSSAFQSSQDQFRWRQQLLLALSISLDELAIGFSLGSITYKTISPFALCLLIGLQGFLMTLIGLSLGYTLRLRLKLLKDWSELLSAVLLIGLGVWLFFV